MMLTYPPVTRAYSTIDWTERLISRVLNPDNMTRKLDVLDAEGITLGDVIVAVVERPIGPDFHRFCSWRRCGRGLGRLCGRKNAQDRRL
jgi:hypothetical protein